MHFKLATDLGGLAAYLAQFLALVGEERWKKRTLQLARESKRSPFQTKITADYHWLEMELSTQMIIHEHLGRLAHDELIPQSLSAMYFAGTVVEVHSRLSRAGRIALEGRLRDALKANTGFASIHLEMEIANILMIDGFDVEFPDLEGRGQYDIFFAKDGTEGEVECKSLSADAGRKIHRKDFYRFIDALGVALAERAANGANEVLIVTVKNRFPADTVRQKLLRTAANRMLTEPGLNTITDDFFKIIREDYDKHLGAAPVANERDFYRYCCDVFGDDCHVSGVATESGSCLVVVRSQRQDDHTKPLLEAMKKAASQLSAARPGLIAIQFDDIVPADLALPHLRRRIGLVSNYLFHEYPSTHLAATFFCAYAGVSITQEKIGMPAFGCLNPNFGMETAGLPFQTGLSDSDFAEIVGAAPTANGALS